ncbi:hypothetical protein P154DRAFT_594099 [Amniculicola lignicola CBS 123094]|uniref:DUF8021 domain-containing protein n=1 Tax=Amniculicola lignicola CBS 123094 TaxID=1392246 RepID=A0A6A5WLM6_9PLEO|nr:hypothetical protein P154DRAFT_594099 [Amniculicola lignicola CBS 123094]
MQLKFVTYAALASQAAAECSRAALEEGTAAYLKAQAAGKSDVLTQGSSITYAENDVTVDIAKGIISKPVTVDFSRSIHDTTECSAFVEVSAATNKPPYVLATRLLFTNDKLSGIQSVVAKTGDWVFNATSQLAWASKEKWEPIPEAKRDSRAVLKSGGDLYLDSWGNGSVKAPYGTPCARLEGGMYTGDKKPDANTCHMPEFPKQDPPFWIKNRRYVIDEALGGVAIFHDFPFIDKTRPNGTQAVNFFRVEGGLIRYIHETTVCATKNCGR